MRRRPFLASALTVTSTIIAGCGSVGSRTEHTDPTVEHDDHDDAKYLKFHGDGSELTTVGVDPNFAPLPKNLFVSISHREDTELRSLTQRVVAPDGDGTPPQLSVQDSSESNDVPHPPVSLSQDGTAAVVAVEEFGDLADETVFIPLAVTRWPESARRLVVESTVELVETGTFENTHVLDGELEFEFTAETDTGTRTADTADSSE
ncbi:hypothetical protein [Natronomonas gomsonensis]|uniref:hypothetical protein n=1 Tax=Natronomonas gomsonensis TaxID=1046043 RepID=UPI0015B97200|nr:hypothetical protein [Natronomonas gomsonensis]